MEHHGKRKPQKTHSAEVSVLPRHWRLATKIPAALLKADSVICAFTPAHSLIQKAESKEQKQAKLEKQDQARLSEYFLKHDAPEKYKQAYSQLVELRKERDKLEKSITTTMVMAEMSKPRDTFVLGRGQYDNKGEKVTPGVPAFLPPMPEDLPRNRLGLAEWI